MKKMTFEEFLQDEHSKDYTGNGDDMGEAFDEWLQDLQVDDWLKYGDMFKKET